MQPTEGNITPPVPGAQEAPRQVAQPAEANIQPTPDTPPQNDESEDGQLFKKSDAELGISYQPEAQPSQNTPQQAPSAEFAPAVAPVTTPETPNQQSQSHAQNMGEAMGGPAVLGPDINTQPMRPTQVVANQAMASNLGPNVATTVNQAQTEEAAKLAQAEKDFAVNKAPLENTDGTPIVGADTSSPEFPGNKNPNNLPSSNDPDRDKMMQEMAGNIGTGEQPAEAKKSSDIDIETLKKEYDPVVIEAIHKIMSLAEIQLAEAGGDQRKEQSVINATTNSLTDVNRIVTGIKTQEDSSVKT